MVILAAPHTRGSPALSGLTSSAYQFSNISQSCDFVVSDIRIVFEKLSEIRYITRFLPRGATTGDDMGAENLTRKSSSGYTTQILNVEQRIQDARHSNSPGKQMLLVLNDIGPEPDLSIVTGLNISCVKYNFVLWIVSSPEEASQTLLGLEMSNSGTGLPNFRRNQPGARHSAPLDEQQRNINIFLHSLSSVVPSFNHQDAVRLCNTQPKGTTIGELLANTDASTVAALPGMGAKKSSRVEALLTTPFVGDEASHRKRMKEEEQKQLVLPVPLQVNTTGEPDDVPPPSNVQASSLNHLHPGKEKKEERKQVSAANQAALGGLLQTIAKGLEDEDD